VRATLDAIPDSQKAGVAAVAMPEIHRYLLSCPVQISPTVVARKMLAYDYVTGVWESYPPSSPSFMSRAISAGNESVLYGIFQEAARHIYKLYLPGGFNDAQGKARSKAFGYGRQGGRRIVRFVSVLSPKYNESITIRIYNDLKTTHAKERTVSLNSDGWKRYKLSTPRRYTKSRCSTPGNRSSSSTS
jgi:hypothetical protein